jgi:hypothetical protein
MVDPMPVLSVKGDKNSREHLHAPRRGEAVY